MHYRLFDHTADLGVEFFGSTREELFAHAALALFDLLVEAGEVRDTETREVRIDGTDGTDLFVNYLREILYLFNGEERVLTACRILRIDDRQVTAEIRCGRFDASRHRIRTEIKAVTYHLASVGKSPQGWTGRIIFDV
jgi:SHS2 domain-containing protein